MRRYSVESGGSCDRSTHFMLKILTTILFFSVSTHIPCLLFAQSQEPLKRIHSLSFVNDAGNEIALGTIEQIHCNKPLPRGPFNICDLKQTNYAALLELDSSHLAIIKLIELLNRIDFTTVCPGMESSEYESAYGEAGPFFEMLNDDSRSFDGGNPSGDPVKPACTKSAGQCGGSCPANKPICSSIEVCKCSISKGNGNCMGAECSGVCYKETIMTPTCHVTIEGKCNKGQGCGCIPSL